METEKKREIGWIIAKKGKGGILAFDIDNSSEQQVIDEITQIQKKEKLGDAVYNSSGKKEHWHVYFFWNNLSWNKITRIIKESAIVDQQFKDFKEDVGFLRMRVTNMPKKIKIIHSEYPNPHKAGSLLYKVYTGLL